MDFTNQIEKVKKIEVNLKYIFQNRIPVDIQHILAKHLPDAPLESPKVSSIITGVKAFSGTSTLPSPLALDSSMGSRRSCINVVVLSVVVVVIVVVDVVELGVVDSVVEELIVVVLASSSGSLLFISME